MKTATRPTKQRMLALPVGEYLATIRRLTDEVLLDIHQGAFESEQGERWWQPVPPWAYREDLEWRVAYLCALCDCTMPKDHPVRRKLQSKAFRVLEAPIRVAPASRFPVVNKEEFENFLDGRPVLTSERRRVNPGQNRYYLRDLILENQGMSFASFRVRYGHVMPRVTRASFDTTRSLLRRVGYPIPTLTRCRSLG